MRKIKKVLFGLWLVPYLLSLAVLVPNGTASAMSIPLNGFAYYECGNGTGDAVNTTINFGCYGNNCQSPKGKWVQYCSVPHSAITDLLFSLIRFLTDGIGLVIIGSLIFAGIQYSTSRGEPQQLKLATSRIHSILIALLVYIFAYAILNYLLPQKILGA